MNSLYPKLFGLGGANFMVWLTQTRILWETHLTTPQLMVKPLAINRVVNAVVAKHLKRLLLVMATGTGKTYTAFQIVHRLRQARPKEIKNVLYLADCNQLIDQTLVGDFSPFEEIQAKIRHGNLERKLKL